MGMYIGWLITYCTRSPFAQDEIFLNGAIILPHKEIKESNLEPGKIIM